MSAAKKLTAQERKLSVLQRDALSLTTVPGGSLLLDHDQRTRASLLRRKLVDEKGESGRYVATDLGRSVLAYREAHTGRATR